MWKIMVVGFVLFLALAVGAFCWQRGNGDGSEQVPSEVTVGGGESALVVRTVDRDSGNPISGAKILLIVGIDESFLDHESLKSGDDGRAVFGSIAEGLYDVSTTANGYELSFEMDIEVKGLTTLILEMVKSGGAEVRFPIGDSRNFVRSSGVRSGVDAIRILIAHGIIDSEADVESTLCANDEDVPVTLTHNDVSIAYRDGQVVSTYIGSLVKEPVCMVVFKGGDTWYVQQKCGNLLRTEESPLKVTVPPGKQPVPSRPQATATPKPGKQVPGTTPGVVPSATPPGITPPSGSTPTPPGITPPSGSTPTPPNTPPTVPTSTPAPPQTPAPTDPPPPPCCPTAEFTPPAEGGTPIRPTATDSPTRTMPPQPTDEGKPPKPTPVDVW